MCTCITSYCCWCLKAFRHLLTSNHKMVLLIQIITVRSFRRCIPRSQTTVWINSLTASPWWITAAIPMWPKGFRANWMPYDSRCSSILHIAWNCDFQIFGPLQKVLKEHVFVWYNGLGSTPRNSLQAGYANLWINWSHIKILLMIFSKSCSNFTCQHHQTGSSCTCPVDRSIFITRYYITVQNYSITQWLWLPTLVNTWPQWYDAHTKYPKVTVGHRFLHADKIL